MAQLPLFPTWASVNGDPPIIRENAMWIETLSPIYQSIRADRIESIKVARNHGGAPDAHYNLLAVIADREYTVSQHANQSDANAAAKDLQIVLENS